MPQTHQRHPAPDHWSSWPTCPLCSTRLSPGQKRSAGHPGSPTNNREGLLAKWGFFWSWSDTQQHNQELRNEIFRRAAEASVIPPLANRGQIGAACHPLSIPAASPLLELEIPASQLATQQPELSLPLTRCPILEEVFQWAELLPASRHIFFLNPGSGHPPAQLGPDPTSSKAQPTTPHLQVISSQGGWHSSAGRNLGVYGLKEKLRGGLENITDFCVVGGWVRCLMSPASVFPCWLLSWEVLLVGLHSLQWRRWVLWVAPCEKFESDLSKKSYAHFNIQPEIKAWCAIPFLLIIGYFTHSPITLANIYLTVGITAFFPPQFSVGLLCFLQIALLFWDVERKRRVFNSIVKQLSCAFFYF